MVSEVCLLHVKALQTPLFMYGFDDGHCKLSVTFYGVIHAENRKIVLIGGIKVDRLILNDRERVLWLT